jgi:hypothetical protein
VWAPSRLCRDGRGDSVPSYQLARNDDATCIDESRV